MEDREPAFPLDVYNLMTKKLISCSEDTPILEVAILLRDRAVGSVIVTNEFSNGRRPAGIITDRDLSSKIVADNVDPSAVTAKDVMSAPVISVRENNTIAEAINLMREHHIKRLAVVSRLGELSGLISADDIFSAMAKDFHDLAGSLATLANHSPRRTDNTD